MSLPPILRDRLRLPVVGSPMFIVSNPELVIAQCKAGIVGSFPALNARPKEAFAQWLERIEAELAEHDRRHPDAPSAPYAVNMIVHRSNDRLEHDLEVLVKHKVPIVITSLGARPEVNEAVHSYGGIVLHDVIDDTFARKAIEKGADGLIAVAAGAGGHAGVQSPFALVQEIRGWFDGPLLLSGCIARGDAIVAALAMGADLAYIGSPFIATVEANAPEAYKQMIVESGAQDIVYTDYFSGVHGNYLKPSIRAAGLDPEALDSRNANRMNFGSEREKPKTWSQIWGAGQGIGAVDAIVPAGELVDRLRREYRKRLDEIAALAKAA
ncbi:nitronate monooxygenase family protein [Burkholderiaceae bacterium FT117]|uniref:NAD(P)H-dependent flavin oxidoreductase n=1 Tax=Zeimonas sediminis TaxID=2944268 RepID=UPI00234317F7|nr:nitronate monooxygenase family protein [Zeimonas sediminis]MCM5572143.1 nitronate monooxygenase family protein [Zeimonas sediminis]